MYNYHSPNDNKHYHNVKSMPPRKTVKRPPNAPLKYKTNNPVMGHSFLCEYILRKIKC